MKTTTIKESVSRNVRQFRQYKKLTQSELAHLTGVSAGYIAFIEMGKRFPSPPVLEAIARVLNVPPYRLLQDDTDIIPSLDQKQCCAIQLKLEEVSIIFEELQDMFDSLQR